MKNIKHLGHSLLTVTRKNSIRAISFAINVTSFYRFFITNSISHTKPTNVE